MLAGILAIDEKGVIGNKGKIPWHITEELDNFKKITNFYGTMIMGRTTYESLPGLLPGRKHVVITRNKEYKPKHSEVIVLHDINTALKYYDKAIVIGGADLMKQMLPFIDQFHLSIVLGEHEGDTFFETELEDFYVKQLIMFEKFDYYNMVRRAPENAIQ